MSRGLYLDLLQKMRTSSTKEEQLDNLLKQEREWTMMFDSDVRVGLALLEEIRKLNQTKEDETIPD